MNHTHRTLTELFHKFRHSKIIPAELYDEVVTARKRRPEVLAFCQRVFLRLRRSIYGEAIPAYGGDMKQLAKKKRKADVVVVTARSMFEDEATETPTDKDPESDTPAFKDPEPMDLTQDKEPLQGNNE